ncbi:SMI1/KNR4 family protein [Polyangium sp. 6x1]|uniref:SMI1/KNR4 family protein n=1 Tax=Polyangium sp. 6x1 TaxID=3042689 RepID=UPI0024824664|nr:SMI1/KNR4 family protein [Polyangium sp. 6x1]MDI1447900.1 SMI1/KNR4 family protein [Polyangium sp. 6x1]
MKTSTPPVDLDPFLEWVRVRSERAWAAWPQPSLETFKRARVGGCAWWPGTRWLGGLTDAQIAAAERKYGLHFPGDYRTFLRSLHAPDRHMFHAGFADETLVEDEAPSFFNWLADDEQIADAIEWPLEGLVFDVLNNSLWRDAWGPHPSDEAEARHRLADVLGRAPCLVPVVGHRYLVEADTPRGYLVLSVYQSDIIIYARDVRTLLLAELADLLEVPHPRGAGSVTEAEWKAAKRIPFWGEFVE